MQELIDTLTANPALLYSAAVGFGLIVGSFLNVVIHRLPIMMEREWRQQCAELTGSTTSGVEKDEPYNLWQPRSRCPGCARPIAAFENIPIVSYVLQRGRCKGCGKRIAWRYPIIEFLGALVAVLSVQHFGVTLAALGAAGLGWSLLALGAIDLDHHLLPDAITLPLLWAGLCLNLAGTYVPIATAVIGAMAGYLILWIVYWGFKLLTGKEGMGYGDFKLLAAIGAWAGWMQLPLVILLASAVGAVIGILLIVSGRQGRSQPIPFGPFLAAAGWIAMLWGPAISRLYLSGTGLG